MPKVKRHLIINGNNEMNWSSLDSDIQGLDLNDLKGDERWNNGRSSRYNV